MTLVLPVPTPAKINCGESQYITASFCSLFKSFKNDREFTSLLFDIYIIF